MSFWDISMWNWKNEFKPIIHRCEDTNIMRLNSIKHFIQINNINCYNYHTELWWKRRARVGHNCSGWRWRREATKQELSNWWLNGFVLFRLDRRFECLPVDGCTDGEWIRVDWLLKWTFSFLLQKLCVVKSNDSIYENVSKRERFALVVMLCCDVLWCNPLRA